MTTSDVHNQHFEILIPVDAAGEARGTLYLDDGESIDGATTLITFECKNSQLYSSGRLNYKTDRRIVKVTVIGRGGDENSRSDDVEAKAVKVDLPLTSTFQINV